jgi:hypothetical protein
MPTCGQERRESSRVREGEQRKGADEMAENKEPTFCGCPWEVFSPTQQVTKCELHIATARDHRCRREQCDHFKSYLDIQTLREIVAALQRDASRDAETIAALKEEVESLTDNSTIIAKEHYSSLREGFQVLETCSRNARSKLFCMLPKDGEGSPPLQEFEKNEYVRRALECLEEGITAATKAREEQKP